MEFRQRFCKANRMRGFWQVAANPLVGRSIEKLVRYIDTQILMENLKRHEFPEDLIRRAPKHYSRVVETQTTSSIATESEFLMKEFSTLSMDK